jgi:hypothetical protein
MTSHKRIEAAMIECYQELYQNSEPSADFKNLLETAKLNEQGQKIIPYWDYQIDDHVLDSIILAVCKKYKFNKCLTQQFKSTIYLGCSPKTKNI